MTNTFNIAGTDGIVMVPVLSETGSLMGLAVVHGPFRHPIEILPATVHSCTSLSAFLYSATPNFTRGLTYLKILFLHNHCVKRASIRVVRVIQLFSVTQSGITDCKLLAVLWSGNDNELCRLQVPICSVMHHCSFVRYLYRVAKRRFPNFGNTWRHLAKF
jgi:hypothetical protein